VTLKTNDDKLSFDHMQEQITLYIHIENRWLQWSNKSQYYCYKSKNDSKIL